MPHGHDQSHGELCQIRDFQRFGFILNGKCNGGIDFFPVQARKTLNAVRFKDIRAQLRKFRRQFPDQFRQVFRADDGRARNPETDRRVLAEHRQLAFNVVEKTREETVKTLSRGSQRKWFTLEQPGSRLLFELHQLLADCGLPDAVRNDLHGIADPFRLGCVVEKLKMMQVHIHSRVSPN